MSEKGIQVQRLMAGLDKHSDLVAEAFEGPVSTGEKPRNASIEALSGINALKPHDEDIYTLNPRLREFIADHLSSYQAFQALRQVSGSMRQAQEQWKELRQLKAAGLMRDMDRLESALEETVIEIAYSIEHNLALLHSLISTQYGSVDDLDSKFRQNKYYGRQIDTFLKDVRSIDAIVEVIGDEAISSGLPHIRHLVVRRLGAKRLQWTAHIKDAQSLISKRLFDMKLMEVRMKRLSRFALWLTRNKTTDGWDLNVTEKANSALFRPEPITLRPQPDVAETDPIILGSLVEAMERMPHKQVATARSVDAAPQMMIIEDEEVLETLKPEQMALRELLALAEAAAAPFSVNAWKATKPEIADLPDQAWLMYSCTQLLVSGVRLRFIGDPVPDQFALNEEFHDIEVCPRERQVA